MPAQPVSQDRSDSQAALLDLPPRVLPQNVASSRGMSEVTTLVPITRQTSSSGITAALEKPMSLDWRAKCKTSFRTEVHRNQIPVAHSIAGIEWLARTGAVIVLLTATGRLFAQSPPVSPDRPWHSSDERQIITDARRFHPPAPGIEPDRVYSLAALIDLAETHNPETRVAWEGARAQAAALGIARSELFPALAAVALAGVERDEAGLGARFYRQTNPAFQLSLDLNYTIFDFGARRGRINAESARLLASNFGFNDVHRQLIYDVSQGLLPSAECGRAGRSRGSKPGERTGRATGGRRASP